VFNVLKIYIAIPGYLASIASPSNIVFEISTGFPDTQNPTREEALQHWFPASEELVEPLLNLEREWEAPILDNVCSSTLYA
jgi:hypothetical protein